MIAGLWPSDPISRAVIKASESTGTTGDHAALIGASVGQFLASLPQSAAAVGMFDIDALRRDRDQLWAEAAAREAGGASIRLSKDLWAAAGEEQDARRVEDPFFETLHSSLGEELEGKVRAEDAWRIVGNPLCPRASSSKDGKCAPGGAFRLKTRPSFPS